MPYDDSNKKCLQHEKSASTPYQHVPQQKALDSVLIYQLIYCCEYEG